jgi:hypothetical protein
VTDTEGRADRTYPIRIGLAAIGVAIVLWVMVPAIGSEEGLGWPMGLAALAALILPLWRFANTELGRIAAVVTGALLVAAIAVFLVPGRDRLRGIDDGLEGIYLVATFIAEVAILACTAAFGRPTRRPS